MKLEFEQSDFNMIVTKCCCVLHRKYFVWGNLSKNLSEVIPLSVFLKSRFFEDCSCQLSKIITWLSMICWANFLISLKKERQGGVWELQLATKKALLNSKNTVDPNWGSLVSNYKMDICSVYNFIYVFISSEVGCVFCSKCFQVPEATKGAVALLFSSLSSRFGSLPSDLCDFLPYSVVITGICTPIAVSSLLQPVLVFHHSGFAFAVWWCLQTLWPSE